MRQVRVLADDHQIYVLDPEGPGPAKGTSDDLRDVMLEVGEQGFTIGTLSGLGVEVELDVRDDAPQVDLGAWDHAVRGGLASSSGVLVLENPGAPDDERLEVPAGPLTVLVLVGGLYEPDAQDEGKDRYRVHVWPERSDGVEVLKQVDWSVVE